VSSQGSPHGDVVEERTG